MSGTCYWCAKQCTAAECPHCGVRQVAADLFDVALLLKRQGLPKSEIASRIDSMSDVELETMKKTAARHRA